MFACNTLKGGRQSLEDFCGVMDFPQPLASSSFSRHLKSVSHAGMAEAERQIKLAALRYRKIALAKILM